MTQPIAALTDAHAGQTCHIVGKGPSLLHLRAGHFGPGPVITLNQAIRTVEALGLPNRLLSMQKDGHWPDPCTDPCTKAPAWMVRPQPSTALLVSVANSRYCFDGHMARYLFDTEKDFGLLWTMPSVVVAIRVAELMGCTGIVFLCMDAITTGDRRTVTDGLSLIELDEERGEGYVDMKRLITATLAVSRIREVAWVTPEEVCDAES
jgi:hypothetical protein